MATDPLGRSMGASTCTDVALSFREAPRPGVRTEDPAEAILIVPAAVSTVVLEEAAPVRTGVLISRFPPKARVPGTAVPVEEEVVEAVFTPSSPPEKLALVFWKPPRLKAPEPNCNTLPEIVSSPPVALGEPPEGSVELPALSRRIVEASMLSEEALSPRISPA